MSVKPCPNCGQDVRAEEVFCPFCGTNVETGERPTPVPNSKIAVANGAILGVCLMLGSYFFFGGSSIVSRSMVGFPKLSVEERNHWIFWATYGFGLMLTVPVAVTGLLYLILRRRFPAFARGLGQTCLVALVIALGAPFICGGYQ